MNLILVIFSIFLIIITGYCFGELLKLYEHYGTSLKISLSLGLGSGIITIVLAIYSILGIEWSYFNILVPIAILVFLFIVKGEKLRLKKIGKIKLSLLQKILLVLISITIFYVFFESTLRPLPSWDGWSAFFFEGKAFYIDGFLNSSVARYGQISNPPLVPLSLSFIFKIIGHFEDRYSLLFFTSFYIAIALVFFESIKKKSTLIISLLFTFLLLSIPNVVRHAGNVDVGHADLIVGYFVLSSAVVTLDYLKNKKAKTLLLAQLLLVFGALTKDEGFAFFVICEVLLILITVKAGMFRMLYNILLGIFIMSIWFIFRTAEGFPENPFIQHIPEFSRLFIIVKAAILELFNFTRWGLIWPMGALLYIGGRFNRDTKVIILLFLCQLASYLYVFFTTPQDPVIHMHGAFDRLLLQILPLFIYGSVLSFKDFKFIKTR